MKPAFKFMATILGLIVVLVLTLAVFRIPVGDSLRVIWDGAFGDKFALSRTAVKATPMLLTGLGMVVAWRAGMYNIGGEGQFIVGGVAGAAFAKLFVLSPHPIPAVAATVGILLSCLLGGALWAWIAGWLFVKRGVDVVISTILLNFVALQILGYCASGPLQEAKKQVPLTDALPDNVMLYRPDRQMDLHLGVLVAILTAFALYVFLFKTKAGFRLRVVGENARAARASRIDSGRVRMTAMLLSGALCGLAGGIEYTGMSSRLGAGFSHQWGFLGIPVALLSGLHPVVCIGSATLFGALLSGSENLSRFTAAGAPMVYVIQAVCMLGYLGVNAFSERRKVAAVVAE